MQFDFWVWKFTFINTRLVWKYYGFDNVHLTCIVAPEATIL